MHSTTAVSGFKAGMSVGFGSTCGYVCTIAGCGACYAFIYVDYENISWRLEVGFYYGLVSKRLNRKRKINNTNTEKEESLLCLLFSSFF